MVRCQWGSPRSARRIRGKLPDASGILLASLGNEDHVALHVASGLVVLSVGDLP